MIERLFSEAWQEIKSELDFTENQIRIHTGKDRLVLDELRKKIKTVLMEVLKRNVYRYIKESKTK